MRFIDGFAGLAAPTAETSATPHMTSDSPVTILADISVTLTISI
jgi:hypothetical protein